MPTEVRLPSSLSQMGVTEAHWPPAREYAISDIATAANAIPFDGEKFDEVFKCAF
jgi:alcohol dehydrogenase class IV